MRFVVLAALPLALSCAPARPPTAVAPAHGEDASYVLALRAGPRPTLEVTLDVVAHDGRLELACDDWGGVEHCERELADVRATDAEHRALPIAQTGRRWTVDATPGTHVTVSYRLAPSTPDAMASTRTRFKPVLTDRYLHVIGHVGLLVPRERTATERSIGLHWRGFREAGWTTACSFGVGAGCARARTKARALPGSRRASPSSTCVASHGGPAGSAGATTSGT